MPGFLLSNAGIAVHLVVSVAFTLLTIESSVLYSIFYLRHY